jgi:signal transduction histidine kinase
VTNVGGDRALRRTLVVAALGGLATLAVLWAPALRVGYPNPGGHVVLETTATLIGGLVAVLLYGRYCRTHRLRELLLVHALAVLSLSPLVSAASAASLGDAAGFDADAALVARFAGALLILAAALVPPTRVRRVVRLAPDVAGVGATVVTIALLILVLDWQPLVVAAQLVTLACYAIAAVAFTRDAMRDGDDLVGWFGAAAVIGASAQVNYFWSQTLYPDWLSLADMLRLTFFVLLFASAVREIQSHWTAQTLAAAYSERRRLARDLHDGVVQELGYIRARAARAYASYDEPFAQEILAAADRAVDEARLSIDALTAYPSEALSATLQRAAVEVSGRYDVATRVDVGSHVSVTPARRDALVRIVREAVSNAARHGAPRGVEVTAADGELTVRDDGRGFDPAASRRRGSFGLASMSERAASVGAVLQVTSEPDCGTTVRVTW